MKPHQPMTPLTALKFIRSKAASCYDQKVLPAVYLDLIQYVWEIADRTISAAETPASAGDNPDPLAKYLSWVQQEEDEARSLANTRMDKEKALRTLEKESGPGPHTIDGERFIITQRKMGPKYLRRIRRAKAL